MPIQCMDLLTRPRTGEPPAVIVLFGDEEFLRRQAFLTIRAWVLPGEPDDFTFSTYRGEEAKARDVFDDLRTPPFLGDRRLVFVEDADKFVTQYRELLVEYAQNPSASGVLLLSVKTFPSNTKLYRVVDESGLAVDCKPPQAWHVGSWCVRWAADRYGKKLAKATADWLVELVGPTLGLLDQELDKLSVSVGDRKEIDIETVNRLVAGTRSENVFKLLDMALEGNLDAALTYLDRELVSGESPVGILAMITAQLRKLTKAARLVVAGQAMDQALRDAGMPPFALDKAKQQLRHFGRPRMAAMYRQLLDADLDMKGGTALNQRIVIERFLVSLARPAS